MNNNVSLHLGRPETESLLNLAEVLGESVPVPSRVELSAGTVEYDHDGR